MFCILLLYHYNVFFNSSIYSSLTKLITKCCTGTKYITEIKKIHY
ncbi:hypothetical protein HMPREF9554_01765 [Treponema phagedenis F0421]|nr:hypothetical protein HMPREF9554_01765 [Treponema phagedenis F0421]